jgi:RNA polymerase sigma factor (sigma-70 family)
LSTAVGPRRKLESAGPVTMGLRLFSSQFPTAWPVITYEKGAEQVTESFEMMNDTPGFINFTEKYVMRIKDRKADLEKNKESGFNANLVEQKSKHAMLNQAISMLSPDDAQVLNLFYKGDQSLEEIGKIMRLDPNTVKVKLHRARQRLKEKMEKYFAHEVREIYAD